MSFSELYDSCFKNASLLKIPSEIKSSTTASSSSSSTTNNNGACTITTTKCVTLDSIMTTSKVIGFYFTSVYSTSCITFTESIKKLIANLKQKQPPPSSTVMQSSPAKIRRFFGVRTKSKKKHQPASSTNGATHPDSDESVELSIVVICLDAPSFVDHVSLTSIGDVGWFVLSPECIRIKTRLLRALRYQQAPAFVLVDTASRTIIIADGKRALLDDPIGSTFPWLLPTTEQIFQGSLLKNIDGKTVPINVAELKPSVKALLFAANWCPPCRIFLKQLTVAYESLRSNGINFEVIFCSSDRTDESFRQHFSTMPWLAFPFDQSKLTSITRYYNVHGIPALLILDESNRLITKHGRNAILSDPNGKYFPWKDATVYELNEYTLCRLKDLPSLILFTEGSADDVTFSINVLRSTADDECGYKQQQQQSINHRSKSLEPSDDNNGNNSTGASCSQSVSSSSVSSADSDIPVPACADQLQFFYTGDDPICDQILDNLGLGDMELPLIAIVDALAGHMAVCAHPDVSDTIVRQFVDEYRNDRLQMVPIPTVASSATTRVSNTGDTAISQALGGGISPSQSTSDMGVPAMV